MTVRHVRVRKQPPSRLTVWRTRQRTGRGASVRLRAEGESADWGRAQAIWLTVWRSEAAAAGVSPDMSSVYRWAYDFADEHRPHPWLTRTRPVAGERD